MTDTNIIDNDSKNACESMLEDVIIISNLHLLYLIYDDYAFL